MIRKYFFDTLYSTERKTRRRFRSDVIVRSNVASSFDFDPLDDVGGGCGVQDVAYFLSSCLDDEQCERHAERHLDTYFAELRARVPGDVDGEEVERRWRDLYPAAWADFHRFLAGWAPDHWKIHRYTRRMTREALDRL